MSQAHKLQNYINHIVLVLDESSSMTYRAKDLIKVADSQIAYLAKRSQELNQETRITVYSFAGAGTVKCLIYDMDVLRVPSIEGMYKPHGSTALIDATVLALNDLALTPEKYGEHAFLIYVLTDGEENSSHCSPSHLESKISYLPDHWTVAVFVPHQTAKFEAKKFGFPSDNIAIWDTTRNDSLSEVGEIIRKTSDTFMQNRAKGIRGSKSLFSLKTISIEDIHRTLTAISPMAYSLRDVLFDTTTKDFCIDNFGYYTNGQVYYQLMKPEDIQDYKGICVVHNNKVYSGSSIRSMLGLPSHTVRVDPEDSKYTGYTIYVQSTAPNRKLLRGTKVLIMTSTHKEFTPWTGKTN